MDNQSLNTSSEQDPYKWYTIGLGAMIVLTLPVIIAIVVVSMNQGGLRLNGPELEQVSIPMARPVSALSIYQDTCKICHGQDGEGVVPLGKPLRNSAFIQSVGDEELFDVIANGRMPDHPLNTSGSLMPARGARNIDDDQINKVIGHLRSMQDPSQPTASTDAWVIERTTSAVAFDGPGRDLFVSLCSACHGANGEGMDGLGKPFTSSDFINDSTDKEITTMVKMGRPIWDAANTTGIDMPPKGGNPAMSDEELGQIIEYIRWLNSADNTQSSAPVVGRDFFISMCSACHGANGEGMEGLGKPFTTSNFIKDSTDKEIIMLVKMGRPIWDAANTTGVDMPPKGGNPAMSDDELNDIITYIRSISID